MEIPAWMFFTFCAITGVAFLRLGFNALDRTDLSDSVPPTIMSLLKYSLAISICHSSNYALIFRPLLPIIPIHKYCGMVLLAILVILFNRTAGDSFAWSYVLYLLIGFFFLLSHSVLNFFFHRYYVFVAIAAIIPLIYSTGSDSFVWYFVICAWINLSVVALGPNNILLFGDKIGPAIFFVVESSLFLSRGKIKVSPILVLITSFVTSVVWAAISRDARLQTTIAGKNKKVRLIEFGVWMAGTILFQNLFRLTSFDHVLAFLYFAVAWLANLALLRASFDFGVFNFLLSNVIVGCGTSQSGPRGATWLVYGASLVLYGLRLKLESVTLLKRGGALFANFWVVSV